MPRPSGQLPTDTRMDKGMNDPQWNLANFNAQPISHPDPLKRGWERDVHFDYIDAGGVSLYSGDGIMQIQGQFSRNNEQKGLALIARGAYGRLNVQLPVL